MNETSGVAISMRNHLEERYTQERMDEITNDFKSKINKEGQALNKRLKAYFENKEVKR